MKKHYDYLVVGAGLFGAVFAQQIRANNKTCLVIDARDHIAGNAYTSTVGDILVHQYGAHIFHTSYDMVWDYVNRFANFDIYSHSPIAVHKGQVYNLPFNMNTFYKLWGTTTPEQARAKISEQIKMFGVDKPTNLEEQAISMVGYDIYNKLIKGYTEKQWGRPCAELPIDIIKRLPLRYTYDNNYFNDSYQGIPQGGYTEMVSNMLEGVHVELGTDYFDLIRLKPNIATKIVYTGMIDKFFDYCYGHLEYRSLHFETTVLDMDNYQGAAVANYTERHVPYTRIIEHKHFASNSNQSNKTVITREYPKDWTTDTEPYYPINDAHNEVMLARYQDLSRSVPHVIFGGRLGHYKYYDMDKAVLKAIVAVKNEFGHFVD
ncbi:MAG: UDP-galactopyranose mutase [Clostridiales bacterium]|jgi:UDP-galactopyranose mutase|nr:UDP-galactopyranose mutase [Clostridiales bacterium]